MHIVIILFGLLLALGGGASIFASLSAATPGRDIALALGGAAGIVGGCVIVAIGLALLRLQKLLRDKAAADAAAAARLRQTLETVLLRRGEIEEPLPSFLTDAARSAPAAPLPQPLDFPRRSSPPSEPPGLRSDALVMSMLEETGAAAEPPPQPDVLKPDAPEPNMPEPKISAAKPPAPILVIDEAFAAPKPLSPAAPPVDSDAPLAAGFAAEDKPAAAFAPIVTPPAPAAPMRVSPAPQIFAPQPEPAAFRVPAIVLPPAIPPSSAPPVEAAPPTPKPAVFEPPAHVPAPTEVGRYNAGGATYVMFSDGSIEAETETGAYRFASMAELRDYIEQRGLPSGAG